MILKFSAVYFKNILLKGYFKNEENVNWKSYFEMPVTSTQCVYS